MKNTKLPYLINHRIVSELSPSMRYDGKIKFDEWQSAAREKLKELLGINEILKNKPESDGFNIEYIKKEENYTEYRFTLSSEKGYYFPSVMRVPNNIEAPMPVAVALQGHTTGMHISLGKLKYPNDEIYIKHQEDFVVRALKEGYCAVAVEQRNFGECGGDPETGKPMCKISGPMTFLSGRTTIGERVVDASAVIDALITHFDFIDKNRIIILGNSGGGTATYYTACIDERISLAMPSCSVCTYKDSIAAMQHCYCNYIPNIAKYFDMGDLAGLIAPRNLVIVNGVKDDIFPHEGVIESFDIAKKLYAAAGVENKVRLVTGPEGHRFYADLAWPVAHELMDDKFKICRE